MTPVHYAVRVPDPHTHLFSVTLTIAEPGHEQKVSLPVWIPGSYLVREFSKNLQGLRAHQGKRPVVAQQISKNTWMLLAQPGQPLQVQYEVYALDNSVRTAWLDAQRGFFNGTSLCLRVHGQEDRPHGLDLVAPEQCADWSVATGLDALRCDRKGWGSYHAANYSTLVDAPVELGHFWSGGFTVAGVEHRFCVAGASATFDGERLLADTQKICAEQIAFWHGGGPKAKRTVPFQRYVFMLNAVDDGYGGLEHHNSTALICNRRDLPRLGAPAQPGEGYTRLLGLISHEYFHTWNVKRLRPVEFDSYNYDSEQYTSLLWFFEGFTSYYDDLMLVRAGLVDDATYLKLWAKTLTTLQQTPGRKLQSVAQASTDAWIKYYRQDENTPNATVSYYTKGAVVALCLDLTLRREGHTTLDDVMRALWQRCQGGPMSEADLRVVLQELGQRSFDAEMTAWVHGTEELPALALLQALGVSVTTDAATPAQTLGIVVTESASGVVVKHVARAGLAERAGLQSGDEWLGLELPARGRQPAQAWRLHKLEDLAFYSAAQRQAVALVARDKRLLRLPIALANPKAAGNVRLAPAGTSAAALAPWLHARRTVSA